jgi:microcystin-dependent protein
MSSFRAYSHPQGVPESTSIRNRITQYGHPFHPGMAVRRDSVSCEYVPATVDGIAESSALGIIESVTPESFVIVYQGIIDFKTSPISLDNGDVSLKDGTIYYLSCKKKDGSLSDVSPPIHSNYAYRPLMVGMSHCQALVVNSLPVPSIESASLASPVGTIVAYAGREETVPSNWFICSGKALPKDEYAFLYSRLGDSHSIMGLEDEVTSGSNTNDTLCLKFSDSIHSIEVGSNFKLSWNDGNDSVVATVTKTDSNTNRVWFLFLSNHPSSKIDHASDKFGGLLVAGICPVKVESFAEIINGNLSSHFFLPDLRSRTIFGSGFSTGLISSQLGNVGGSQTQILTENELPSHSHNVKVSDNQTETDGSIYLNPSSGIPVHSSSTFQNVATTDDSGKNKPFSIVPPYVSCNWIIRWNDTGRTVIDEEKHEKVIVDLTNRINLLTEKVNSLINR